MARREVYDASPCGLQVMVDPSPIQHLLGSHDRWWSDQQAEFVISRTPPGCTTEDVCEALHAAFEFFILRGERLRKPLAYVLTEDHQHRSMVSRQRARRELVLSPDPDYGVLRAQLASRRGSASAIDYAAVVQDLLVGAVFP